MYYLNSLWCGSIHCVRFWKSSDSLLFPINIIITLIITVYLSLFMKLLFFFFLENTILVAKKIAVKAYRSIGKSLEVFSVYRKILYKSILTESTTILIAPVDYKDRCKGRKRKPTPSSQSSVMGCADKPFYYQPKATYVLFNDIENSYCFTYCAWQDKKHWWHHNGKYRRTAMLLWVYKQEVWVWCQARYKSGQRSSKKILQYAAEQ